MCSNDMNLSLNGETFSILKEQYDSVLNRTLGNMEMKGAEEATITVKVGIKLERTSVGYRTIVRPKFKHDISSVMQVKDKVSGELVGDYQLVWDDEEKQYVMRKIDNGQTTLFDQEDKTDESQNNDLSSPEPPALPGPSGKVIDADFTVVDDFPVEDGGEDDLGSQRTDPRVLFEYMKQFVGLEMEVLDSAGQYTVRTLDNRVVLSSMCKPTDRFYCSPEKLAPHVGHVITCIGSPSDEEKFDTISIWCETCDELLFEIDAPKDDDTLGEDEENVDPGDSAPDDAGESEKAAEPEGEAESPVKADRYDEKTPFGWLAQFVGEEMRVTEAMGNYTVRTTANNVVLSSATAPSNPFYCDREKLAEHAGHNLICAGYGKEELTVISIQCSDCASALFTLIAPGATEEEVSEAMKDGEAETSEGDDYDYEPPEK